MSEITQVVEDVRTNQAERSEDGTVWIQAACCFEPPPAALKTGLESCGLAADDTSTFLSRLAAGQKLEDLSRQVSTGQILTKRTAHGRRHFLQAMKRRYIAAPRPLPGIVELSAMIEALTSQTARNQLLLPYLLLSDRAAFEIVTSFVLPCRQRGETHLSKEQVLAGLYMVFRRHGRKPWGEYLCVRWVEGLLSVLRDVRALGRGTERETLLPYTVRSEVFSFHLWGLYNNGLRGRALRETPFWHLLLLDEQETQYLVTVVAERGWWKLTTLGAAEELIPACGSIGDWVAHELG